MIKIDELLRSISMSAGAVSLIQIAATMLGAVLIGSGCNSSSHSEVELPTGVHCRSESHGSFLWKTTSTACVDASGKVIGSYSDY
jgi:hypothetical protein